ncbi:MAG: hypothetical protein EXQ84_02665 [Rhodospirillaceae bacterium]|nr:hypothetical protein [Rhodospirillaceae bacterium]
MAPRRRLFGAKSGRRLALAIVALLLSACGTAAYVDSRREAGQEAPVGPSTRDLVAICYSSSASAAGDVMKLAESECAKTDRVPELQREERWTCAMLTPRRVFYSCVPKP